MALFLWLRNASLAKSGEFQETAKGCLVQPKLARQNHCQDCLSESGSDYLLLDRLLFFQYCWVYFIF